MSGNNGQAVKPAHVQVSGFMRLDSIFPAPENSDVYNAISIDDAEVISLAQSIKDYGVQEPIHAKRPALPSGKRK
jgi:hypothetical protein